MKKFAVTALLVLSLLVPFTMGAAQTAQAKIETSVSLDVALYSKYIWRGIDFVDDWVAQPAFTAGIGNFSVGAWADYNLTDQINLKNKVDEVDLWADYTFSFGKFSVPLGIALYTFPNTSFEQTTELYTGVSYDWIVTPSVMINWDVDEAHGFYFKGALDYSLDLPKISDVVGWSLGVGASIAYGTNDHNSYYYATDKGAFTDYIFYVTLPFSIGEYVTISPEVYFTGLVDSDVKDNMKASQDDNNIFYGIVFSGSF